jgi:leucyl-tRNA synthetase
LIEGEWPSFDPALTIDAVVTLAIQINGKMRGSLEVARDVTEDEIRKQALAVANVVKHLEGKTVRKVIVVPGRIVNIVVA